MQEQDAPVFERRTPLEWVVRWAPPFAVGAALFLLFFPVDSISHVLGINLHDSFHEVRHALGIACH